MENAVFYWADRPFSCGSMILTLAAAVTICFFLSFYLRKPGHAAPGFALVPLALGLSLLFSRFFHWYCRPDAYPDFLAAMTQWDLGAFALMGAFLGSFLAAVILRLCKLSRNLPEMLDAMTLSAMAGIAVGRLTSLFDSSDRGQTLAKLHFLPFAHPVTNPVSGATEYRLATFFFQTIVALILFLIFARYYRKNRDRIPAGDTCLLILMVYGASQAVLDSTRYDSLFFRGNGFVSVVQVLGAIAVVGASVFFSVRAIRHSGFRFRLIPLWLPQAAALGGAGYMEYYVQRHGSAALLAYSGMTLCLALALSMTFLIRRLEDEEPGKNRNFVG